MSRSWSLDHQFISKRQYLRCLLVCLNVVHYYSERFSYHLEMRISLCFSTISNQDFISFFLVGAIFEIGQGLRYRTFSSCFIMIFNISHDSYIIFITFNAVAWISSNILSMDIDQTYTHFFHWTAAIKTVSIHHTLKAKSSLT